MKKYSFFLLLFLMPISLLASSPCSNTGYQNSTMKAIMDKGYIRIATIGDNPPFYWVSHGVTRGYDFDVMKNIAKTLGVKLKVTVVPHDSQDASIIKLVENNKVDLAMANLVVNQAAAQRVYFTSPYVEENTVLLVNRKKMHVNGWEQSQGYYADKVLKTAVIKNSFQEILSAQLYPKSNPVEYLDYAEAISGLADGKSDILITEIQRVWYLLERNPELESKLVIVKGSRVEGVGFAVNYSSLRLHQWLQFYVTIGRASRLGFLAQMQQKYFYTGADNEGT